MKKDDLLKYIVVPYNIVSASIAIFFMGQGFWNPEPTFELLNFVLKIIIFFGFIFLFLTNVSFYLRNNDYYLFSLKYNFWTYVIQSTLLRLLGFGFNIGAGTVIMVYLWYDQRFSFKLGFQTWNYNLTIDNNLDDKSIIILGFNIVSIVIAVFFYRLIMVEKSKKRSE
ncbi:MAG: hypothetical protein K0B37_09755 [Bacteroidales bacterium]|nr:hypothetical protein [Bacteroidales bacterium]